MLRIMGSALMRLFFNSEHLLQKDNALLLISGGDWFDKVSNSFDNLRINPSCAASLSRVRNDLKQTFREIPSVRTRESDITLRLCYYPHFSWLLGIPSSTFSLRRCAEQFQATGAPMARLE